MYKTVRRKEVAESRELFTNFVKEDFENEGLSRYFNSLVTHSDLRSLPGNIAGYCTPETTKYGKTLRELSDKYAKLDEAKRILKFLQSGHSEQMKKDEFIELLRGIFEHGEYRKNVVGLFFFCSKYLIEECLKNKGRDACARLFMWSLEYVLDGVCHWVERNGGWGKVIQDLMDSPVFKVVAVAALAIGAIAAISYFFSDDKDK